MRVNNAPNRKNPTGQGALITIAASHFYNPGKVFSELLRLGNGTSLSLSLSLSFSLLSLAVDVCFHSLIAIFPFRLESTNHP